MKRDFDLLRDILLKIESAPNGSVLELEDFRFPNKTPYEVGMHIHLLVDNKYIEAVQTGCCCSSHPGFKVIRITSAGYDYLDSVRNVSVWNETKKRLLDSGTSATLDIVKSLATAIISKKLGL